MYSRPNFIELLKQKDSQSTEICKVKLPAKIPLQCIPLHYTLSTSFQVMFNQLSPFLHLMRSESSKGVIDLNYNSGTKTHFTCNTPGVTS